MTTFNVGAFTLDRIAALFGTDVAGLPGYEDFVRLAISAAGLMFFPWCQWHRGHVAVDLFMERAPMIVQRRIDQIWLAATAAVALFLGYWMVFGLLENRSDAVVTGVLGWPEWPFYVPGIASLVLWAAIALAQLAGEPSRA